MKKLKATKREAQTKVKQLRRDGFVPGCIYGKGLDPSLMFQCSERDALIFLKSHSEGAMATVTVDGEEFQTILKEASRIPISTNLEHLSFQKLTQGNKVKGKIDIILRNEELAKGQVKHIIYSVEYRALPKDLIDKIEIDLAGKEIGTSYTLADFPELNNDKIELFMPLDSLIAEVVNVTEMDMGEDEVEEDVDVMVKTVAETEAEAEEAEEN